MTPSSLPIVLVEMLFLSTKGLQVRTNNGLLLAVLVQ